MLCTTGQLANMIDVPHRQLQSDLELIRLAPLSVKERIDDHHADDRIALSQRPNHVIAQMSVGWCKDATVAMAGDYRTRKALQRLPEALFRQVRNIQRRADA